ncbi:MAG TPA: hypothetical protein VJ850_08460 [Candidatus Limnocylindrales bacterium]|nr:hypothetical protein [Candidatus Limnocylindrales bacterium]
MNSDNPTVEAAAAEVGLPNGRMISQSKSQYHERFPSHVAVFNATIADDEGFGAWWGDLDLTLDEPKLAAFAERIGADLHVLWEGDTAWFRGAEPPRSNIGLAVVHLTPAGKTILGEERGRALTRDAQGRLVRRVPK